MTEYRTKMEALEIEKPEDGKEGEEEEEALQDDKLNKNI